MNAQDVLLLRPPSVTVLDDPAVEVDLEQQESSPTFQQANGTLSGLHGIEAAVAAQSRDFGAA
jgi:hypothetical protein